MVNFFTPNEEDVRQAKLWMTFIDLWKPDILPDIEHMTIFDFSDCYSKEEKEAFSKWMVTDIYPISSSKFPTKF